MNDESSMVISAILAWMVIISGMLRGILRVSTSLGEHTSIEDQNKLAIEYTFRYYMIWKLKVNIRCSMGFVVHDQPTTFNSTPRHKWGSAFCCGKGYYCT